MTDFTAFPIANVTIPSLPDLGGVTDATMLVGERAGTGRFAATGLRDYVMTTVAVGYLPLSGGSLTGNLSVSDTLFFGASSMSLSTGPDYSIWTLDSGNYDLIYGRHTGVLQYRGLGGVGLWSVDASGNSTVAGNLTTNNAYARGGRYYFGSDDGAFLSRDSGSTTLELDTSGWALNWNRSSGALAFVNNAGLTLFVVDAVGNGTFHGTVHGTNVVLLEARIEELQARINDLQETLATRIAALEARMGTGTAD